MHDTTMQTSNDQSIMQHPAIRLLFQAMFAWMILRFLLMVTGEIVTAMVVVVCGLTVATIYMLRFERHLITPLYDKPGCKQFIDGVCRISKQQAPVGVSLVEGSGKLQLNTPDDFQWCAEKLKEEVFGHDDVIDAMTAQLKKTVLLRHHSKAKSGLPPLGVFFLAGAPGIGKRLLTTGFGRRLFRKGGVTVLNINDCTRDGSGVEALFGASGGYLINPVKMRPYHTIVLENIESATPKLHEALQSVLMHGSYPDPAGGGSISFQNCLIVMTSTLVPPGISRDEPPPPDKLAEAVSAEIGCPRSLLSAASEVAVLQTPDDVCKAKAILALMIQECGRYNIELQYAEPEIVAREVEHFCDASGFPFTEMRITKLLRDPIATATAHDMNTLVLTREMLPEFAPSTLGPPHVTSNTPGVHQ